MNKKSNDKNKYFTFLKDYNIKWVINIFIVTFLLAIGMSFTSEALLRNTKISIAFIVLIVIVFIGVFFDAIGIAVATAKPEPFNSMASNKIKGAKYAIKLIKNASPVSNFCNDVIGDIAGIVSGAAGAIIVLQIRKIYPMVNMGILSIIISGVVASLTVGGKAFGKEIALKKSKEIVYWVAKLLYWINSKLGIELLPDYKKSNRYKKVKGK